MISVWQNNYLAWALDHAQQQGFKGGQALRDRLADFQLKLFTGGKDYPRDYAAPYYPLVGTIDKANKITFFTTMKELFEATNRKPDGTLWPPVPFNDYGRDARLALMISIQQGKKEAKVPYDWLMTQLARGRLQDGFAIALETAPKAPKAGTPLGKYLLTRGWATFGIALPQGVARGGLKVGKLPTQTDVKTTWPDGSIRFAVVTASVVTAGAYSITPAKQPAQ